MLNLINNKSILQVLIGSDSSSPAKSTLCAGTTESMEEVKVYQIHSFANVILNQFLNSSSRL